MSRIHQLRPDEDRSGDEPAGTVLSGMDVPRPPSRRPGRFLWIGIAAVGIAALTLFLGSLEPAVPGIDGDLLVIEEVQFGPMVMQVHGWGSFVPDRVQEVRAEQPGKVSVVYAVAGEDVRAGDRLIELVNTEIEISVDKAEQKFASARAGMIALSRELSARRLALEAAIADTRATYLRAEDELEELVSRAGGKSNEKEVRRARERLRALGRRVTADEERLELISASAEAQTSAQRDELRWLESILESERARLRSLTLRASGDGIVEEVLVEPGSRVGSGTVLARVALSDRLKAELNVTASEGREIEPGLPVSLESTSAVATGRVSRVERVPGRELLALEVALDENPRIDEDQSHEVYAVIQVGTLDQTVFVRRPAFAGSNEWGTVFQLTEDGSRAERVKVRYGRGSIDRIEVREGLEVGDRVVVSDMSEFDGASSIEIR